MSDQFSEQDKDDALDQYLQELEEIQDHSLVPHYWAVKNDTPPLYKGLTSGNLPKWIKIVFAFLALSLIFSIIFPIIMQIIDDLS